MKDLKHMIFFEELLRQSHNTLVQQAVDEGQLALGYNCYYIPEVLLNLRGCFSSRLRAPNSGTAEVASYYMTNRNCPYVRWWSAVWRAATSFWTRWPAWTPAP